MKLYDLMKTLNEGIYVVIYKVNNCKPVFEGMAYNVGRLLENGIITDVIPTGIYKLKIFVKEQ